MHTSLQLMNFCLFLAHKGHSANSHKDKTDNDQKANKKETTEKGNYTADMVT